MKLNQDTLMKFDPATNEDKPFPSHAGQYREFHGDVAWLYNPWTGNRRDARDIGTDVFGHLIAVPDLAPMGIRARRGDIGKVEVVDNDAVNPAGDHAVLHATVAIEMREACLNCYSPDDTVSDYQDKMRDLDVAMIVDKALAQFPTGYPDKPQPKPVTTGFKIGDIGKMAIDITDPLDGETILAKGEKVKVLRLRRNSFGCPHTIETLDRGTRNIRIQVQPGEVGPLE